MKKLLILFLFLIPVLAIAEEDNAMLIKVSDAHHSVIFRLNDTPAAASLYAQLSLETEVENYGSNEKIFYPTQKLEGSNAIETGGSAGGLAYFSPWGNMVMYYGDFGAYPGLYVLGEAVEGVDQIASLEGVITVTRHSGVQVLDRAQTEEVNEALSIPASLGNLYGELHIPASASPVPLIILSHGFGGNHTNHQDYTDFFFSYGYATFSLDFCGGGWGSKSDGTMLEMSVLTEATDLNAVIDYFKDNPRFSSLFLMGFSQGGFVSSYVAAQRPQDVDALILEYPAYVLQDDARQRMGADGSFPETSNIMGMKIGRIYSDDAVSFDIYDVIPAYTGDVLILHGDRDGIVPLEYSERAAEVFPHAQLIVMPGQGHGFSGASRQGAMEKELEFIQQH